MQYKDLKEMNIKDWDGVPFNAYVCDNDDAEVGVTHIIVLVCGYMNRPYPWWTGAVSYKHAYPVEWNKEKVEESSKPKRMTNRQLAMWLTKGNGERSSDKLANSYHDHSYPKSEANDFVDECILVRKWDSEEWVEPTVDLLED